MAETVHIDMDQSHSTEKMPYPSVVERYFEKKYKINKTGEDVCVLLHSNRICVLTLAPSHPVLRDKKVVTKVDFRISDKLSRLDNRVSGKMKKGAQYMTDTSPLCCITCADGSRYSPRCALKSSLIEVNENLLHQPALLCDKPSTDGYIAIVLTKLQDHEAEVKKLTCQEDYEKLCKAKMEAPSDESATVT